MSEEKLYGVDPANNGHIYRLFSRKDDDEKVYPITISDAVALMNKNMSLTQYFDIDLLPDGTILDNNEVILFSSLWTRDTNGGQVNINGTNYPIRPNNEWYVKGRITGGFPSTTTTTTTTIPTTTKTTTLTTTLTTTKPTTTTTIPTTTTTIPTTTKTTTLTTTLTTTKPTTTTTIPTTTTTIPTTTKTTTLTTTKPTTTTTIPTTTTTIPTTTTTIPTTTTTSTTTGTTTAPSKVVHGVLVYDIIEHTKMDIENYSRELYPLLRYTPIGIRVIDKNQIPDSQNARYMSIPFMSRTDPENGVMLFELYNRLDYFPSFCNDYPTTDNTYIPNSLYLHNVEIPNIQLNNVYGIDITKNIAENIITQGSYANSINEDGYIPTYNEVDAGNKENGIAIRDYGCYPLIAACYRFKTVGTDAHEWYLPTADEWYHAYMNLERWVEAITYVGGEGAWDVYLMSGAIQSCTFIWKNPSRSQTLFIRLWDKNTLELCEPHFTASYAHSNIVAKAFYTDRRINQDLIEIQPTLYYHLDLCMYDDDNNVYMEQGYFNIYLEGDGRYLPGTEVTIKIKCKDNIKNYYFRGWTKYGVAGAAGNLENYLETEKKIIMPSNDYKITAVLSLRSIGPGGVPSIYL